MGFDSSPMRLSFRLNVLYLHRRFRSDPAKLASLPVQTEGKKGFKAVARFGPFAILMRFYRCSAEQASRMLTKVPGKVTAMESPALMSS